MIRPVDDIERRPEFWNDSTDLKHLNGSGGHSGRSPVLLKTIKDWAMSITKVTRSYWAYCMEAYIFCRQRWFLLCRSHHYKERSREVKAKFLNTVLMGSQTQRMKRFQSHRNANKHAIFSDFY